MSKVITGNPGVGKHTVAKHLAKKLDLELVDINKIVIQTGMFVKKDGTLDVDVNALKKTLSKEITKKSLVVGHLAPYVLSKKQVELAIVLRKNPYKLISVYKKRNYSHEKSIENLGSEILDIILYDTRIKFGSDKTFQIDTSLRPVSLVVKKIESLFVKGSLKQDIIDWLSLISNKNDLNRFFPY